MPICKHDGCEKHASFNYVGHPPKFCASHKKLGMINRIKRLCSCGRKIASIGYAKDGKLIACADCKVDGMISLTNNKAICRHENCEKVAYFKFDGDIGKQFCADHKLPGMISRYHCTMCNKLAYYGYYGGIRERCAIHREPDMNDLVHKKCVCNSHVSYGYALNNLVACYKCKKDGMMNVKQLKEQKLEESS